MKLSKNIVLKNIFLYGLGDFIVTGVNGFLLIPYYIHHLSNSEYGEFSVINTAITIFTYFIQFGLISGFSRVYYINKGKNTEKAYLNTVITFHLIFTVFLTLLFFLLRKQINHLIFPSASPLYISGAYTIAFLSFIPAIYAIRFRLENRANKFVFSQLATVIILILSVFYFLHWRKKTLEGVVTALVVTNLVMWAFFTISMLRSFRLALDKSQLLQTFKISLPAFVSYIAYFLVNKFSIILLQRHVPVQDIGIFSLAQQLAQIPVLTSVAIGKAIQPNLFNSAEDTLPLLYKKYNQLYTSFMICVCSALIIFSTEIIQLFSNASYAKSKPVFIVLIVASWLYTSVLLHNTILQYFFKSKHLMNAVIVGSIVSIALNYLFIPVYYVNGAAAAILLSFLVVAGINAYSAGKQIRHTISIKRIIDFAIVIIILIACLSAEHYFTSAYSIVFKLISCCLLVFIIARRHIEIFFNNSVTRV